MTTQPQLSASILRPRKAAFVVALLCGLTISTVHAGQAQSFRTIHSFSNAGDGGSPTSGVTIQGANLYGTASTGGTGNAGTVYQLKRSGDNWTLNTIHTFQPSNGDGAQPLGGVTFGPNGTLYGMTYGGGTGCYGGCGTVYNLRPPQTFCRSGVCEWTETILHNFRDYPSDGGEPFYSDVAFDAAGNLFSTTCGGGSEGDGTIFELTHSNGGWTEAFVNNFNGLNGECPYSGVLIDADGNLFGTAIQGTGNQGVVYETSYNGTSWVTTVLEQFYTGGNGNAPAAGLVADAAGNLYGMTVSGTVYELTYSGGAWQFNIIFNLPRGGGYGTMAIDAAGNLYGSQFVGGMYGEGAVFKLTNNNGSWSYTDMHDFSIVNGGAFPYGGVTLDNQGHLYGTTTQGGILAQGCGYWGCGGVWEITLP